MRPRGYPTISMFLLYRSLAPATAVRLLASAVAWTDKRREKNKAKSHSERTGGDDGRRETWSWWSHCGSPATWTLGEAAPHPGRSWCRPAGWRTVILMMTSRSKLRASRTLWCRTGERWRCRTLKYSSRSLQVTLLPPISFSTSCWGARRRGTSSASFLLKSPSISEGRAGGRAHTHTHTQKLSPKYFVTHILNKVWLF